MLEIKNAKMAFEGVQATNDITMSIPDGKVTALIGPNGAGKTTLFNLIYGVYQLDSGSIKFDGKNLSELKPYDICKLGIARTYQVIKIFKGMSVLDNVLVGMHTQIEGNFFFDSIWVLNKRKREKEAKNKAMQILTLMGLADYASFSASSLSYGQQRLLEIARALGTNPKLLLLDEPAAGMNAKEKELLNDRIRKIIEMGVTVLLVEHDMSMVMSIAEKIYVINRGELIAQGSPEEIKNNPDVIEAYLGKEEDA